jgi:hypothetical protein
MMKCRKGPLSYFNEAGFFPKWAGTTATVALESMRVVGTKSLGLAAGLMNSQVELDMP